MKFSNTKETLLGHLRKSPTIEMACKLSGIDRKTYYNWTKKNKVFAKEAEMAIQEGRTFMCEVAESVIFSLIKDKRFEPSKFYLTHNDPRYSNKLEISANIKHKLGDPTDSETKDIKRIHKMEPF